MSTYSTFYAPIFKIHEKISRLDDSTQVSRRQDISMTVIGIDTESNQFVKIGP
jgi:hypothetical protein